MKQLFITLFLLSGSLSMTLATNNFESLAVGQHSIHTVTASSTSMKKNKKYYYAQRAAKQGNVQAVFDLAMMHALGDGLQRDTRKAFNLFHQAARKGHIEAKYCMAVNFQKGLGVKKQNELARYWFKLAAKAGHPKAMNRLLSFENREKNLQNKRFYAFQR